MINVTIEQLNDINTYRLEIKPEVRMGETLEAVAAGADLGTITECLVRSPWIEMDMCIQERIDRRNAERRASKR